MKPLIAVTCLALLAAVGFWFYDRHQAQVAAKASASAQELAEIKQHQFECSLEVEQWDQGDRSGLVEKYGAAAQSIVDDCRWFMQMKVAQPSQ